MSGPRPRFYEFGEFRIDSLKRTLQKNGDFIALKGKAFDLLLFMVESGGEILNHEQIMDAVWEGTFVEQANLKKNISTLRKVLDEQPDESSYIQTLPKKGYRFVASVTASNGENASAAPDDGLSYRALETSIEPARSFGTQFEIDRSNVHVQPHSPPAHRGRYTRIIQIVVPVLAVAVAIGGYLVWKTWRRSLFDNLKLENVRLQKLPTNANVQTSAISPDGQIAVFATLEGGDRQALWMRRTGTPNALQLIAPTDVDYRAIVVSPDSNFIYYGVTVGQTENYLYRIPILGGTPRKIIEGIQSQASFSPDGKRICFVRDNDRGRTLYTANALDGNDEREVFTTPDAHNLINPRFSPDGQSFAFVMGQATANGRLWVLAEMPAIGGKISYITQPQKNKIYDFAWLVDGSGFIICAEPPDAKQTQIYRVKYPSGEITKITNDFLDYQEASVSADGRSVLALQQERVGNLWSTDTGNLAGGRRIAGIENPYGRFTVLPGGQLLYIMANSGEHGLLLADADGGNSRKFTADNNFERDPAISPDGKSIIFLSKQSGSDEVWQSDLNGANLKQLTNEKTFIATPKISPDGKYLYFQRFDETAYHLIRLDLQSKKTEIVFEESTSEFDFSPDGNYLAYGFFNKDKKKWNVAVRSLADNSIRNVFDISISTFLSWTPDGRGLIYNTSDVWREGGNLSLQPIDGGPPKPYLDATPQKIYSGDFSADGKTFYFMRGETTSSLVMIRTE